MLAGRPDIVDINIGHRSDTAFVFNKQSHWALGCEYDKYQAKDIFKAQQSSSGA